MNWRRRGHDEFDEAGQDEIFPGIVRARGAFPVRAAKRIPSQWAASKSAAAEVGCSAQKRGNQIKRYEIDTGPKHGVTRAEPDRIRRDRRLEP